MNSLDVISLRKLWRTQNPHLFWQFRYAYDSSNLLIYQGMAPQGKLSSEAYWFVEKLTYDVNNNVVLIQGSPEDSIWDDRATLTYS